MGCQFILEVASAFASSHCVLVTFQVESTSDLTAVLEFGRRAVQVRRVGLLLKSARGVRLGMAAGNQSGLPFPIASSRRDDDGEEVEEFLCPTVGEQDPIPGSSMCKQSHASYREGTM